jgi:hypothetical protein
MPVYYFLKYLTEGVDVQLHWNAGRVNQIVSRAFWRQLMKKPQRPLAVGQRILDHIRTWLETTLIAIHGRFPFWAFNNGLRQRDRAQSAERNDGHEASKKKAWELGMRLPYGNATGSVRRINAVEDR